MKSCDDVAMLLEKPNIDRAALLEAEHQTKRMNRLVARLLASLTRDEELGTPVRRGNYMEIPILQKDSHLHPSENVDPNYDHLRRE